MPDSRWCWRVPKAPRREPRGLSLFLLPRTLPDGSANRYRIQRLKDKLGTRAMPSGEIKLEGALAWLVGDPQQGFKQMADMINMSRLSNGMRAAGLMRRALTESLFVARNREAFGKKLIELPLMRRQLLKLMLPTEAARSVLFFISNELIKSDAGDESARRRVRLLTPLIKFRACRDARRVTGDAMEVRGGVGYTEEWSDPRLVRDAHLGSIWEGTSNIVALDVLRAIRRENCLEALLPVLERAHRRARRACSPGASPRRWTRRRSSRTRSPAPGTKPTPGRRRPASTTPAPPRCSPTKARRPASANRAMRAGS